MGSTVNVVVDDVVVVGIISSLSYLMFTWNAQWSDFLVIPIPQLYIFKFSKIWFILS